MPWKPPDEHPPAHQNPRQPQPPIVLERFFRPLEAYPLLHFLQGAGLPVRLRESALRAALGEIPFLEAGAVLLLDDPAREEEARELIAQHRQGHQGIRGVIWQCRVCHENHAPEFDTCWNCGTPQP